MCREEIILQITRTRNLIFTWQTQNASFHCDDQIRAQNIEKIHAANLKIAGLEADLEELEIAEVNYQDNIDPEEKFYKDHATYLERTREDDEDGDYDDMIGMDMGIEDEEENDDEIDQPNSPFQNPLFRDND